MDVCPQTITPIVEILCYVKVRRAPGQPAEGRCKCELAEPWPVDKAGEKQPTDAQLGDRYPGSVAVVRRSAFKYAGGPVTRCNGPLRYDVCKYKRRIEIWFNASTPVDSYDSPDIFEVEHLVGICPVEAIKGVFGVGSALTSLVSIAPSTEPSSEQMLAAMLASAKPTPQYHVPPKMLSQYAIDELSHWLSTSTQAKHVPLELACMQSGRADFTDIVSELSTLKSPLAHRMQHVLQRLISAGVRGATCGSPDDFWLAEAAADLNEERQK